MTTNSPGPSEGASNPATLPLVPPVCLSRVALIAGITLWIYWPALRGGFIWDDKWYITLNPQLHSLTGLWKFWFRPGTWVEYYPLHETVLWLQWHLFGADTLGYHLTNVTLHVINALLVWRFLARFGLRLAWLGGLIFAVHPVQIESVAYICELKNTLSLPFFLLSLGAWIDYEESKSKRDYQNALALYFAAMLCKISMAPFAAVILLYAWWKRGRIGWADAKACTPFLLIAVILTAINLWSGFTYESTGHTNPPVIPLHGLLSRLDAVGLNATVYFARCFLPVDLLYVYPQWPLHPRAVVQYLPWLVLAGVVYLLWTKRRTWGRHVLLGLGFFLIMLSPFLGFTAISYMEFIWVMDHFLYIPIIGLIGVTVAGIEGLDALAPRARPLFVGAITILIALLAWVSHAFAGLFVGEEVLWPYILQRNPTVWLAQLNDASKLMELERYPEAVTHLQAAILLRPGDADGYYNLGIALDHLGRTAEAQAAYSAALRLNPDNPKLYLKLGQMARHAGNLAGAESLFGQGLKIAPDDASLCLDMGGILFQSGRTAEAISLYQRAVESSPDVAQLQYDLGVALLQTGRISEAADHFDAAVTLDPKMAAAHENLGGALAQLGRLPEAIAQFNAAVELEPGYLIARNNLALALAQTGRIPEAIDQFEKVLQLDPANARARDSLAKLQQYQMQQKLAPAHP